MEKINLYNGDCLEEMKIIPDKTIDMICTDLPYGTTNCSWDSIIPFEPLWEQYERIIKDTGNIILTASQPFTSSLIMSNPKLFRYEIIWEKERPTNIFNMKRQIGKVHENILVFYKKWGTYNPKMEPRKGWKVPEDYDLTKLNNNGSGVYNKRTFKYSKGYDSSKKYPRSVIYRVRDREILHATQKPVSLLEYLIETFSNENDVVLDNTMGSGTTGIACLNTNRNFIGIELDKKYFDIASKRILERQEEINASSRKLL